MHLCHARVYVSSCRHPLLQYAFMYYDPKWETGESKHSLFFNYYYYYSHFTLEISTLRDLVRKLINRLFRMDETSLWKWWWSPYHPLWDSKHRIFLIYDGDAHKGWEAISGLVWPQEISEFYATKLMGSWVAKSKANFTRGAKDLPSFKSHNTGPPASSSHCGKMFNSEKIFFGSSS